LAYVVCKRYYVLKSDEITFYSGFNDNVKYKLLVRGAEIFDSVVSLQPDRLTVLRKKKESFQKLPQQRQWRYYTATSSQC